MPPEPASIILRPKSPPSRDGPRGGPCRSPRRGGRSCKDRGRGCPACSTGPCRAVSWDRRASESRLPPSLQPAQDRLLEDPLGPMVESQGVILGLILRKEGLEERTHASPRAHLEGAGGRLHRLAIGNCLCSSSLEAGSFDGRSFRKLLRSRNGPGHEG